MNPIVIIPSRLASTRLPNKPLADIEGKPMIVRVCDVAREADLGPVVVACGDSDIAAVVTEAGYEAVLTNPHLPSGSDRVHSALEGFDPDGLHDVVINLQGDMPTLSPEVLSTVLAPLHDIASCEIATLVCEITESQERTDPNVVKAVLSMRDGASSARALYFTRATAPHGAGPLWHHVGVYAYRRHALSAFVNAPASPLEQREKLEQLRALEMNMRIDAAILQGDPPNGVDTPADLEQARTYFREKS